MIKDGEQADPWAFLDTLSPVTRKFVLDWLGLPWTLHIIVTVPTGWKQAHEIQLSRITHALRNELEETLGYALKAKA